MNLRLLLAQLTKRPWFMTMLLWVALAVPAQAAVQLRVAVEKGVERLKVGSSTNAVVKDNALRSVYNARTPAKCGSCIITLSLQRFK